MLTRSMVMVGCALFISLVVRQVTDIRIQVQRQISRPSTSQRELQEQTKGQRAVCSGTVGEGGKHEGEEQYCKSDSTHQRRSIWQLTPAFTGFVAVSGAPHCICSVVVTFAFWQLVLVWINIDAYTVIHSPG